jgi:hypothetical protein
MKEIKEERNRYSMLRERKTIFSRCQFFST